MPGTKKPTQKELRETLYQNLESRGLATPVYVDQVEEYLTLCKMQKKIEADINKRGVMIFDEKRKAYVDNPCISRRVQLSHQKLAIFAALGFKDTAVKYPAVADTDDEL